MTGVAVSPLTLDTAAPAGRRLAMVSALSLTVAATFALHFSAHAADPVTPAAPVARPAAEAGARWQDLKPAQQVALKPLERDWSGIDLQQKQKWLELSARFPRMSTDEQTRVQARMAEWTKLTPRERGTARLNYQEAQQLPAQDRQARWESYQALSPDQKRQLAERAAPASAATVSREAAQAKSNLVPNPAFSAPPTQVAPTVTRAGPGATTTLMSKRPSPPTHQQTGLPKIAATPEFVNKATLQPQRGPQAAATRSAKASDAEPSQRQ